MVGVCQTVRINSGVTITLYLPSLTSTATYYAFISIMCLGLPAALTVPRPDKVIRGDGSRVVMHRTRSLKREIIGLGRVMKLKSFLILFPYLVYWVCIPRRRRNRAD